MRRDERKFILIKTVSASAYLREQQPEIGKDLELEFPVVRGIDQIINERRF